MAVLRGRDDERAELQQLVRAARDGRSGVLVVLGEAGVGKTALLDDVVSGASDLRVVRVAAVESEMELPFAALHQLCGPLLDRLDRLPAPQRDALATVFGLAAGPPPTPFLVGLAVLTLLSEVAAARPLACVVDDAQWLDGASAQALAFVARRLGAESVLMLFAAREPMPMLSGLPELVLRGLPDHSARELLASVVRWPLDERVRAAVLAEARGNPLALLELPLAPDDMAGGYRLPLAGRIETSFLRRLDGLSERTRLLMLVAAADPVGDSALLWRAAGRLGLGRELADEAEAAGLLRIGVRVVFRHPLVRSAIYRAATAADRRRAHRALAEATSARSDPDRHAWHRAYATADPDESVAAELEAAAGRAQSFGGSAAAAAFLERAAELTPDPAARADRQLAAAWAKSQAGANDAARLLLARAGTGPPDALRGARIAALRGQLTVLSDDKAEGPALQVETARKFEHLDARQSRAAYLDAFAGSFYVGRFAGSVGVREVAAAARQAPPASAPPTTADLLLDGLALLLTDGYAVGVFPVRRALVAFLEDEPPLGDALRFFFVVCEAAQNVWDDHLLFRLTARYLQLAREAGALTVLPIALHLRISVLLHNGEIAGAATLVEELDAISRAAGYGVTSYAAATVAAWRGDEATAVPLVAEFAGTLAARGEGLGLSRLQHANAMMLNGLGRHREALEAAELATFAPRVTDAANRGLVELVEAAVHCGEREIALRALERLTRTAEPSGTPWALGACAYTRALIFEDEDQYREAIERLGESRGVVALGRAHLAYGEWLRRKDRRADALPHVRKAHEIFTSTGAEAFADRTRRELTAAGERIARPAPAQAVELTDQERQIARRARDGQSNPEIGAELFLSTRTVEWHLRKVFAKLGISSRRELRDALTDIR
ncbi:AAA family ATPase [Actinoplanes sp. CA-142083]|uniref:AAA family ATPase n=1 Tax=Actinoplanes sp. CA-142083 TaxID=3239903 RepID=UPI003D9036C1